MKKQKIYYAGFTEGKLDGFYLGSILNGIIVKAIFETRKEAVKKFKDVRPVTITEIK